MLIGSTSTIESASSPLKIGRRAIEISKMRLCADSEEMMTAHRSLSTLIRSFSVISSISLF
jgi:hypothetical protein